MVDQHKTLLDGTVEGRYWIFAQIITREQCVMNKGWHNQNETYPNKKKKRGKAVKVMTLAY